MKILSFHSFVQRNYHASLKIISGKKVYPISNELMYHILPTFGFVSFSSCLRSEQERSLLFAKISAGWGFKEVSSYINFLGHQLQTDLDDDWLEFYAAMVMAFCWYDVIKSVHAPRKLGKVTTRFRGQF